MSHNKSLRQNIDFICIGAQKSGTTWLFYNLKQHPNIWVPPCKGIQYFFGYMWVRRMKYLRKLTFQRLRKMSKDDLFWSFRFLLPVPPSERWYVNLFPASTSQVVGEFAEGYSLLDTSQIVRLQTLFPNLKIILLLRDPVDRTWSQVRMHLSRKFDNLENEAEAIEGELSKTQVYERSHYKKIIEKWESIFPSDQIYVDFYDRIAETPHLFLTDICHFIGVDFKRSYFEETAERRVFEGKASRIPYAFEKKLRALYLDDIRWLSHRYGGVANEWLHKHINASRDYEPEVNKIGGSHFGNP